MVKPKPLITIQEKCRECNGNKYVLNDSKLETNNIYKKEICPICKGKGTQTIEIYALRDFEKIELEEGNLKIGKGDRVFIQEALGKGEEHTKLFLSDKSRETIKGIVN